MASRPPSDGGRLYRRTADRRHAGAALRDATRRRLAQYLSYPRGAAVAPLVLEIAERIHRRPEFVGALIDPAAPLPTTDRELVRFGQDLIELEKEVRRT